MRTKLNLLKYRLYNIRVVIVSILMLMPLFLILIDDRVRPSISNYAYSDNSRFFVMLLSVAGLLFIYKYVIQNKFINFILGISLIGVALTPHLDYTIIHYIFATSFFIGSAVKFIVEGKKIKIKIAFAIIIILGIALSVFGVFDLIWGEWLAITPIVLNNIINNKTK